MLDVKSGGGLARNHSVDVDWNGFPVAAGSVDAQKGAHISMCLTVKVMTPPADASSLGTWLDERFPSGTVLMDIEPFLSPWGGTDATLCLESIATLWDPERPERLALITNSARYHATDDGPAVINRARKPFTALRQLKGLRPVVVAGDTLITDGVLSVRLGVPFAFMKPQEQEKARPLTVRLENILGRFVRQEMHQ